ncbi:immunoglobulin-like domain-containing protein [Paenilisteria newyorkensis]|uniref:immunoglobulin-like domain-containing protein n=1 Tax=Listeria newyorkensis TaxID=1497681 RepID=UPI000669BAA6|nr:immunoglobulin-like domain-containing protein [Listeria newyorkensis]KMT63312.1 hypothetical protein X559_0308 [Listeria newyorkensis]
MLKKKVMTVLATTSIVGSTIMSPFTVMAAEDAPVNVVAPQSTFAEQVLKNIIENPTFNFNASKTSINSWDLYRNNVAISNAMTGLRLVPQLDADNNISTNNENMKLRSDSKSGELQGYIKGDNTFIIGQTLTTIPNHEYKLVANYTGNGRITVYDGDKVYAGSAGLLSAKSFKNSDAEQVEVTFTAKSVKTSIGNRAISDLSENWQEFGLADIQVIDVTEQQAQDKAREAVTNLFENQNPDGNIISGLTQSEIDNAQSLINEVTDADEKAELQAMLYKAQVALYDAASAEAGNQYNAIQRELMNITENPAFNFSASSSSVAGWNLYRNNVAISNAMTSLELTKTQDTDNNALTTNENIKLKNGSKPGEIGGYIKADNTLVIGQPLKTASNRQYKLVANYTGEGKVTVFDGKDVYAGSAGLITTKSFTNATQEKVEITFTAKSTETTIGNRMASNQSANWQEFAIEGIQIIDVTEELAQNKAREAVDNLFENKDPNGNIKEDLTQTEIDDAQKLIDQVTDPDKNADLQKDLDKAQSQLDAKQTTGTITTNDFEIGLDKYVTGTYSGDVARIAMLQDGVEIKNATLKNGEFSFYVADKKINENQAIFMVAYDKNGKELAQEKVTFVSTTKGTVTPVEMTIPGDKYITGTYTGSVTKIEVTVNGTLYKGGTVADGNFQFYSQDKILKETDEVVINAYDHTGKLLGTTSVTIKSTTPTTGTINPDAYKLKSSNITGTFEKDVKSVIVTVNGTAYKGGTFNEDGTFKFYALDKIKSVDDEVTIQAFDAKGKELDKKVVEVTAK